MSHRHYLTTLALVGVVLSGCLTDGRFILRGPGLPVSNGPSANPGPGAVTPTTPVAPQPAGALLHGSAVLNGVPLGGAAVTVFRVADARTVADGVVTDAQGAFAAPLAEAMEAGTILLVIARKGDLALSQTLVSGASLAVQADTATPARLDLASTIVTKRLLPKLAEAILTQPAGTEGRQRAMALLARLGAVAAGVNGELTGPVQDDRLRAAIADVAGQPDNTRIDALSQAMVAYGDASPFVGVVEVTHQAWLDNLQDGGPPVGPRPWQVGSVRVNLPVLQARGDTQVQIDHQGRTVLVPQPLWRFQQVPPVIAWLERLLGNGASPAIGGGGTSGGGGAAPLPTPTPLVGIDTGVTIVDGAGTVQAGLLTTQVAGMVGHEEWLTPENGTATSLTLFGPMGLAVDRSGNVFIADMYHRRVRKLAPNGQLTTVAGSGTPPASATNAKACIQFGFSCNSFADSSPITYAGPAVGAILGAPAGLVVDKDDNLYFSDAITNTVRKVSALDGSLSTVVGTTSGFAGDGGFATAAKLKNPGGLAFDSLGNLYIADTGNHHIRKVDTTGRITTVIGTTSGGGSPTSGSAANQLNAPTGVAIDRQDNLYVADSLNHRVMKAAPGASSGVVFAGTTGSAGTAAGANGDGGLATAVGAKLYQVSGLALDRQGNLYIAGTGDNANPNRIRKVDASTGIISTFVGGGTSTTGVTPRQIDAGSPASVAVDALGAVYFVDRVKAILQVVR